MHLEEYLEFLFCLTRTCPLILKRRFGDMM
jgi:hypothetical protein